MRSLKYSWGHEPRSVLSPNLPTFTTQHSWMSCPSPRWRWTSSLLLNPSPATSLMHWYRSGKLNIHPPALPCLCAGWAQAESCEHQFVSIFLTSSLAVFLWHFPYKCQKVPIMKKVPAPLTAHIWVWLISFFLKPFLVFQYGAQAQVPLSQKPIQPLTGFSVRSLRKYFHLEVFAWGFFLLLFIYFFLCLASVTGAFPILDGKDIKQYS